MNKHNTVKKNIIDFHRDGDFYFDRAQKFLSRGDALNALENLRRAQRLSPEEDFYTFRIARIYSEMGLYSFSDDIYFKLISQKKCVLESYFGLTQNYMEEDDIETAYHYLKCSYERHKDGADPVAEAEELGLDADDLYDVIEELEDRSYELEERKGLRLVYDRDIYQRKLLMTAHNLMGLQEFDKAVEAYSVIKPDSKYYCEALNGITICRYLVKNYKAAAAAADEAERLFPNDVLMLCSRLLLAAKTKDSVAFEKYLALILEKKDMQESERYRAAMVFCEVGRHGLAAQALETILEECPYDPQVLLLCAQAHFNDGDPARAAEMCRRLMKIDERDSIAKYYLRLFAEPKKAKVFYTCQVPSREIVRRVKKIAAAIKAAPDKLSETLDTDGELFSLVLWVETLDDISFQLVVYNACLKSGNVRAGEYLRELLLSTAVNSFLKKQLLILILNGTKGTLNVSLTVDEIFTSSRYNAPRQLEGFPSWFREGYNNVFATLAFMERNFEAKLNSVARELLKAAEPHKHALKDKKALSAALHLLYGGKPAFKSKSVLCEIYNTNLTTLRAYTKKMGLNV